MSKWKDNYTRDLKSAGCTLVERIQSGGLEYTL
jgi:hypothetical protein